MSTDTNDLFARIIPVDAEHAERVLNTWSLTCNFLVTQTLAAVYGIGCVWLPMVAGLLVGFIIDVAGTTTIGLGVLFALIGAAAGFIGLHYYGFPVLAFERWICTRFLKSVELRANPVISPFDPSTRVVELVPRQRWRKRLCLDTATDLMMIRVDLRGVWMKGDRYRYEFPAESILGAELEQFRPPSCSFPIYMVIIYVRSEEGTIELPISYRDHRWRDLTSCRRRAQAMDLVDQINVLAKGHLYRPPQPPTVDQHEAYSSPSSWSSNPYAAPALINE